MNTVLFEVVNRLLSDKHKRDFAYKVKLIWIHYTDYS